MNNKSKKILIVEDERAIARALELKLSHSGFSVKVVGNGEEALQILEKEKFDLVLLDLVMPKLDGFGVLKGLAEKNIKTKIIVVSNLSQEEDRRKAKELGASSFFVKSDTPITDIVSEVKKILS